jgi:hypothetical protein
MAKKKPKVTTRMSDVRCLTIGAVGLAILILAALYPSVTEIFPMFPYIGFIVLVYAVVMWFVDGWNRFHGIENGAWS